MLIEAEILGAYVVCGPISERWCRRMGNALGITAIGSRVAIAIPLTAVPDTLTAKGQWRLVRKGYRVYLRVAPQEYLAWGRTFPESWTRATRTP